MEEKEDRKRWRRKDVGGEGRSHKSAAGPNGERCLVAERARTREGDRATEGRDGEARERNSGGREGGRERERRQRTERARKERHSISLLVISREIFGFVGKILF